VKILVVDDHPLILEALQHVLRQLDADVQCYEAQSADAGRQLLATHPDAGLLLLDLNMPGVSGMDLLVELREAHPTIPVVVISGSDRREAVLQAIDAGAMGFIPKRSTNVVMLQALRLVLSGGVYVPMEAFAQREVASEPTPVANIRPGGNPVPSEASPPSPGTTPRDLGLTERQAQVLALLLHGKPNKLICRELGLAEGTVKIHVAAILRALNVSTRTQAVIEASRQGLKLDGVLGGIKP